MAYEISEDCINCSACSGECPENAIYPAKENWEMNGRYIKALSDKHFFIVPEKCTNCDVLHITPPCSEICPMDCIIQLQNS